MKIILIQVLLPIVTYFIGVMIGRRSVFEKLYWLEEDGQIELVDPEDLQHVGYSQSECGYDK